MKFSEAYSLTYDHELAIKLMEADASQRKSEALESIAKSIQRKSEALESIAKSIKQCVGVYGLRIEKRG